MTEEGLNITSEISRLAHSLTKKVILCIIAATIINSTSVIASVVAVRVSNSVVESNVTSSTNSLTDTITRIEEQKVNNYNEIMDRLEILGQKMDDMRRN
jgi:hypothetical protein